MKKEKITENPAFYERYRLAVKQLTEKLVTIVRNQRTNTDHFEKYVEAMAKIIMGYPFIYDEKTDKFSGEDGNNTFKLDGGWTESGKPYIVEFDKL